MNVRPIRTRVFLEGENLFLFIAQYLKKLPEKSVVVITSKIVALGEKRTTTVKNASEKEKLIREESTVALKTKYVWLTIKDGMLMASAGIDESNANGTLILLPRDSFKTARLVRKKLQEKYGVRELGVIITDSRTFPLRAGVVGVALGYAGFRGARDYRGAPDIYGRKFVFSRTNVADGLATAAVLLMGEGNEQQPLALIENAPIHFCDTVRRKELYIAPEDDMYGPLFAKLRK